MQRKLEILDETFLSFIKTCGFAIRDGHRFVEASISSGDDEITLFVSCSKQQPDAPIKLMIELPNKTTLYADLTNARLGSDE
jgi:hypothetical protein